MPKTHYACGRILFEKDVAGAPRPIHNLDVRLLDDDFGHDTELAVGRTDMEGRFRIGYNPRDAGLLDTPDLKLEVLLPETLYSKKESETPELKRVLTPFPGFSSPVADDVKAETYDFGDLRVALYEYGAAEGGPTPRLLVDDDHVLPQTQRGGRNVALTKKLLEVASYGTGLAPWPVPLTKKMEEEKPGSSQTDEFFVEMLLNGFNPVLFKRERTGAQRYYVDWSWKGQIQDGVHYAPETRCYFDRVEDGALGRFTLTGIEIAKRVGDFTPGADSLLSAPKLYTKECGEELWNRVKRIVRSNYFVFGEAQTHLGGTHLNVEQYIVPVVRNLRANPVVSLLTPHFYGTVDINHQADGLLVKEDGGLVISVPEGSAAVVATIGGILRAGMQQMNWHGFAPRKPQATNDRYGHAATVFWGVLTRYVDYYFDQHLDQIVEHWAEVKYMSDELVAHSIRYVQQEDGDCLDTNELNKASSEHPTGPYGAPVSLSPVTKKSSITRDDKEDLENLKQLCRYVIYFATWQHSWVNDSQYDTAGDSNFATMGIHCDLTDLTKTMEDAVPAREGRKSVRTTYVLATVEWGYILANEDGGMNPKLISLLKEKKSELAKYGVDAAKIRSTINI